MDFLHLKKFDAHAVGPLEWLETSSRRHARRRRLVRIPYKGRPSTKTFRWDCRMAHLLDRLRPAPFRDVVLCMSLKRSQCWRSFTDTQSLSIGRNKSHNDVSWSRSDFEAILKTFKLPGRVTECLADWLPLSRVALSSSIVEESQIPELRND